jgi:hypothetical protein
MSKWNKALLIILNTAGVFTAVGAALLQSTEGYLEICLPIITASIAFLWLASLINGYRTSSQFQVLEGILGKQMNADTTEQLIENVAIQVAQSVTFHLNRIDDRLWIVFAKDILNDASLDPLEKLRRLSEAKKSLSIVLPKTNTYDLMDLLLHSDDVYSATTYYSELRENSASKYLYELPMISPGRIRRLFVLTPDKKLDKLPEPSRNSLRSQLENGAEFKFIVTRSYKDISNIGIYGRVAVGVLQIDGSNLVHFDETKIALWRRRFEGHWENGTKVTLDVLGFIGPR